MKQGIYKKSPEAVTKLCFNPYQTTLHRGDIRTVKTSVGQFERFPSPEKNVLIVSTKAISELFISKQVWL